MSLLLTDDQVPNLYKGTRKSLCTDFYIRTEKLSRCRLLVGRTICGKAPVWDYSCTRPCEAKHRPYQESPRWRDLSGLCTDGMLPAADLQNVKCTACMAFHKFNRTQGLKAECFDRRFAGISIPLSHLLNRKPMFFL